jgi:hypothetical protein
MIIKAKQSVYPGIKIIPCVVTTEFRSDVYHHLKALGVEVIMIEHGGIFFIGDIPDEIDMLDLEQYIYPLT